MIICFVVCINIPDIGMAYCSASVCLLLCGRAGFVDFFFCVSYLTSRLTKAEPLSFWPSRVLVIGSLLLA